MDAQSREPADAPFEARAFVRGLTHELANPLNAVTMNCELLRLLVDRGDPERLRTALAQLAAASARCTALMRGLQTFGSALRQAAPERVPARTLVEVAIAALTTATASTLPRFEIAGDDRRVRVDRAAVERAIVGLLRNAMEAGSDLVKIDIRSDEASVIISFYDNGVGFAAEHSDAPFYTTRRVATNAGLGLTLVREVLRLNRGSLSILPAKQGAHVELRLPIANASGAGVGAGP